MSVMDEETRRIVEAIVTVSRKRGALVTREPAPTARAIALACADWEAVDRHPVTPELKDTAPWAAYEMNILRLGRAIDLVIRKCQLWSGRGPVLDVAASIAQEARFGRGRQSFTATLGEHGLGAYGPELARLLDDEALGGYAIKALHRGGYPGFSAAVRAVGERERGRPWVRMAASAYLAAKLDEPENPRPLREASGE
jgi:hypothetical protein